MASTSQPSVAVSKITLEPMMTLEGHKKTVRSMHYFPDGKRMISGSYDKTTRQWDMQTGKEIEKARDVCKWEVKAVAVSRNSRWVITAGGDDEHGELKACEVETSIVKTFKGHSQQINCIDICADSTLFVSGSDDFTTRIWSLDTGKLVAGPFKSPDWVGAVRFSRDSKRLAVNSWVGMCLEVWNVQTQILEKRVGHWPGRSITFAPVFWTNKETILAVFNFTAARDSMDRAATIYEFDASTLETVRAPFKGHTKTVCGLALSLDGALVASASEDDTIKLWAFESRQLLASFHAQLQYMSLLILSPDSGQLTYLRGSNIYVCKVPPDILSSLGSATTGPPTHVLDSEATRRPRAPRRNPALSPVISCVPMQQRPLPATRDTQQLAFLRHLRKFLRFSSLTDAGHPVPNGQPRDPLAIPAPSLLHPVHSPSSQATPQGRSYTDRHKNSRLTPASPTNIALSATPVSFRTRLSSWWPVHATPLVPPIVDVPLAQGLSRNATAGAPKKDDDLVPDEYFDSSNLGSQQPTAAAPIDSAEHGRSCFCL